MMDSIGTGMLIILFAFIWFGRNTIKAWFTGLEEATKATIAENAVETSREVQKANKRLEELITENKGKLVSADDIINRARGTKSEQPLQGE